MEEIYKGIKKDLTRMQNSPACVEEVEQSLQTSLSELQYLLSVDQCLLVKSGIMPLMSEVLTESTLCKQTNEVLSQVMDCITAAIEHGRKCKSYVMHSVTAQCLDIILSDCFDFQARMTVLGTLNNIFSSLDIIETERFVQMDWSLAKMKQLFNLIFEIGDYGFQLSILESLLHVLHPRLRKKYSSCVIEDPQILKAFLMVNDSSFDVDSRNFLNYVNSTVTVENRRVFSFPCQKITLAAVELQKRREEGYDDFWMDINLGSRSFTIFHEDISLNTILSSQASSTDDTGNVLLVNHTGIKSADFQEEGGFRHARIYLKDDADCVPHGTALDNYPVLHIVTDVRHNLEPALRRLLCQTLHLPDTRETSDSDEPPSNHSDTGSPLSVETYPRTTKPKKRKGRGSRPIALPTASINVLEYWFSKNDNIEQDMSTGTPPYPSTKNREPSDESGDVGETSPLISQFSPHLATEITSPVPQSNRKTETMWPVLMTEASGKKDKRKPDPLWTHLPLAKVSKKTAASNVSGFAARMPLNLSEEELEEEEEMMQGAGTEQEGGQAVMGINSLLQEFGLVLNKNLKERESAFQEWTKNVQKSNSQCISRLWRTWKGKRVQSVMEYHRHFRLQLEQVEEQHNQAQKRLREQMKQDLDRLKTRLLQDMH